MRHHPRTDPARRRRRFLQEFESLESRVVLSALVASASPAAAEVIPSRTVLDPGEIRFDAGQRSVWLFAQVAYTLPDGGTDIGRGTVTFTVRDGSRVIVGPASAPLRGRGEGGSTAVILTLPANLAPGQYQVTAEYSGFRSSTGPVIDRSGDTQPLVVPNGSPSRTVLDPAVVEFDAGERLVQLVARVDYTRTDAGGAVFGSNLVLFTVRDGSTVIGSPIRALVSGRVATASYKLPAGLAPGQYQVTAEFSGITTQSDLRRVVDRSSGTNILVVSEATTTKTTTTIDALPILEDGPSEQSVPITARVTGDGGAVRDGTVLFQITRDPSLIAQAEVAEVVDGVATASLKIPAGGFGAYTIRAHYVGSADLRHGQSFASQRVEVAPGRRTVALDPIGPISLLNLRTPFRARAVVTGPAEVGYDAAVWFRESPRTARADRPIFTPFRVPVRDGQAMVDLRFLNAPLADFEIEASYEYTARLPTLPVASQLIAIRRPEVDVAVDDVEFTLRSPFDRVLLGATVTSDQGIVDLGELEFTLWDGDTPYPGKIAGAISQGRVQVQFDLPGLVPSGQKTIRVSVPEASLLTPRRVGQGTLTLINPGIPRAEVSVAMRPVVINPLNDWSTTVTAFVYPRSVSEGDVTFRVLRDGEPTQVTLTLPVQSAKPGQFPFLYPFPSGYAEGRISLAGLPWGTYELEASYSGSDRFAPSVAKTSLSITGSPSSTNPLRAFTGLTPSLSIDRRQGTVAVAGTVAGGAGEEVVISIGPATATARIGADGKFSATIDVRDVPTSLLDPTTIIYRCTMNVLGSPYGIVDQSTTLSIRRGTQALSLPGVPATIAYGATFRVRPVSDAGLPVTLDATNARVVPTGDGAYDVTPTSSSIPVILTATQSGNSDYAPADPVSATVSTTRASASIVLSGLDFVADGTARTPTVATTPPGLVVTLTYTRDGVQVDSPVSAGTYLVTATIVDENYAGTASVKLTISAKPVEFPPTPPVDPTPTDPPVNVPVDVPPVNVPVDVPPVDVPPVVVSPIVVPPADVPVAVPPVDEPVVGPVAPPVAAAQSARLVTNRRKGITSLVVAFGQDLDPASAADRANYRLATAGKKGSFDARNAKVYRIRRAVYDAATRTVTLELARPLNLAGVAQLRVYGALPRGLRDALGRPIDGNRDGQAGGDLNLSVRRKGIAL